MLTNQLPDSIAHLPLRSREQIQAHLSNMRDGGYALAALCLAAHKSVHMNHEDAAEQLASVIGKNLELAQLSQAIAREMNR